VQSVRIDMPLREISVQWKGSLDKAAKLESTCASAGVPAVLCRPMRIVVQDGGRGDDFLGALRAVAGVTDVTPESGGHVVWADPAIDLAALVEAAKQARVLLKVQSHRQVSLTYEAKKDGADPEKFFAALDETVGVLRLTRDDADKSFALLSTSQVDVAAVARKWGLTLKEKK
jgi:hypothetical protein